MNMKPGCWEKMYSYKRLDYEKKDNMVGYTAGFPLCMRDSGNRAMDMQSMQVAVGVGWGGASGRVKKRKKKTKIKILAEEDQTGRFSLHTATPSPKCQVPPKTRAGWGSCHTIITAEQERLGWPPGSAAPELKGNAGCFVFVVNSVTQWSFRLMDQVDSSHMQLFGSLYQLLYLPPKIRWNHCLRNNT